MRLAVVLVALSLLSACRSTPEVTGTLISATPPPPRTVAVVGTAEIESTPDEFVISVGLDTFAGDAPTAKADNDKVMRALLEVPRHFDVDAGWVRTEGFSINPRNEGSWETRRVVGFEVHKTLVITLHEEKNVEPVLEALFRDGANRLDGVRFKSQRILEQRKEARTRAVAQAREKAEAMAAVLGQKVTRPLKMEEAPEPQSWPWNPPPQANAVFNNDTRSELHAAMASGKIRIPATVSVTFELSDG